MAPSESSRVGASWPTRRVIIAAAAAVALAVGGAAAAFAVHGSAHTVGAGKQATAKGRLAAASCTGPAGAGYIAVAGYQAFDAIDSSDCYLVQQYNVGDSTVPGTGTEDFNYDSTDEGVALSGDTLYFADTGNDTVAVINAAALNVDNYEFPAETNIQVGHSPQNLAVTPDGSEVWVADTGPQTSPPSLGGISVISTATDAVTATIPVSSDPRDIAFSPSGTTAYVTTGGGLLVIDTSTLQVTATIHGLGSPEGVAVSADGTTVYVTSTSQGRLDVISTATNTVTGTIKVGQLPWQVVISPDGSTIYVSDPDSDAISVISTASDKVTNTIPDPGGPISLALTPDGSRLWVGGITSGNVTVFDTATDNLVGSFSTSYYGGANSADGLEPTGIVLTSTPTPGSS